MFTLEDRERVRERVLEHARADSRVTSAAVVGAEARGELDRWSDIDLTFGVGDGTNITELLADWTRRLAAELDAIELFDLPVGSTVYRVFLFPCNLQVDLSFTPQAEFGPASASVPRPARVGPRALAR
jgi:predicted nucleotidyltransferase